MDAAGCKVPDLVAIGRGPGRIVPSVKICGNDKPGVGASVADEIEDLGIAVKWLSGPVFGDFRKQPVLNGIPFGSAARIMRDRYGEPESIAELDLKFCLPGPGTTAVAAAGIGKDEQLPAVVTRGTLVLPATCDGMGGEGSRVMGDADENGAAIRQQIVNAVRNGDTDGIGAKIVIVYVDRRAIPLDAVIFEVADQFSLFGVDADNRKPLPLKAAAQ